LAQVANQLPSIATAYLIDSSSLSHEFLFARFAWAVIKMARTALVFQSTAVWKAFRLTNDAPLADEEAMAPDDGDGDKPIDPQGKSGIASGHNGKGKKRKRPDSPDSTIQRLAKLTNSTKT
jgi:hypothetical protein